MGGSSSKSKSKSGGMYQDSVWGGQSPYLTSMYGQAGDLFGQTNSGMQGQIPGAVQGMQDVSSQANPAWQQQLGGGVYQNMDLQNNLMNSLNQSQNNPSAMSEINGMIMGGDGNNYADAMKSSFMTDAGRAQDQMLQTMDARAVASGMSGGSRHGTAIGQGMRDINQNLQQNLAMTGYNTFDKDLERKLQIAGQADQNTFGRQQMMSDMLGQQQNTQNQGIQGGMNMQNMQMGQFAPYMMPWDAMNQYANTLGGPTILGQGSQSGKSSSKGLSGGAGGGKG
tara:strand:- start:15805 stop:16647 length:843 start_codon:yes stop_codon:yes gene_type:complete